MVDVTSVPTVLVLSHQHHDLSCLSLLAMVHHAALVAATRSHNIGWSPIPTCVPQTCAVTFRSPIDGSKVFLSPEVSMEIQKVLNSDIVMIFDECTPYPATHEEAQKSLQLSFLI